MRSRQAQLYWLLGDADTSAAAMAEAQRCAERVTWPDALVGLALSKAELARWGGNAEEAYQQLSVARTMLGDGTTEGWFRVVMHDLLGYLADDLGEARAHRAAACAAASEVGHAPVIAKVLVGVADLAPRCDQYEQAARLLAASAAVRGLPDRSTRTWRGSSRSRGTASAKRGSPRRRRRGRRRAGVSWSKLRSLAERGTRPAGTRRARSRRTRRSRRVAARSVRCALNDHVAVPRARVDRDLAVRRVQDFPATERSCAPTLARCWRPPWPRCPR